MSPMPPPDLDAARRHMVDSQIRPNRVSDGRVIAAMRRLPRERFLPAALADRAYIDEDVPLGQGRVLIEPLVIARMVQLARPIAGERALVVGAGTGYGAALLDACGLHVTALEQDEALLAIARPALAAFARDVTVVQGPLAAGVTDGGAWDIVLIEGAVPVIPPAIAAQVRRPGGRLVTVLSPGGVAPGQIVLAEPSVAGLRAQPAFDASTALLPPLVRAPGFVF
jgi:protein-L-isoaspartate(D-aspartate) O-methyltransferase